MQTSSGCGRVFRFGFIVTPSRCHAHSTTKRICHTMQLKTTQQDIDIRVLHFLGFHPTVLEIKYITQSKFYFAHIAAVTEWNCQPFIAPITASKVQMRMHHWGPFQSGKVFKKRSKVSIPRGYLSRCFLLGSYLDVVFTLSHLSWHSIYSLFKVRNSWCTRGLHNCPHWGCKSLIFPLSRTLRWIICVICAFSYS